MPNVALLLGASLIGAIFAGIFLLYSDEGFSNSHAHSNDGPPPREGSRSQRNSSYSQRFDTLAGGTPAHFPKKRRKRTKKDEDLNCVICCEEVFSFHSHSLQCEHEFHLKCIQQWVKQQQQSGKDPTCPICRTGIGNPTRVLNL